MRFPLRLTLSPQDRARLLQELAAAGLFLAAAVWLTWPTAAHFATRLGGDAGDPLQTLWSWRWVRDALLSGRNPFFTERVFYPEGASLVFQTFDLPTALLAVPLWSVLPPAGVYNAGVLFAFWLTAWGMYRLVLELAQDRAAAIWAGVLFTSVPYHLAHAPGHQHLVSMGWLPLYLVYLHRMLGARARLRDAALGGLFLALAALASWYHLLFAMIATAVLFADAALSGLGREPGRRPAVLTWRFWRGALVLAAAFLAVAGPLLVAILVQRGREPMAGAHDAVRFSGDLEAFFFPNLIQSWWRSWGGRATAWTGNAAETALYAGYTALALALAGAALAGGRARAYLAVALGGGVLALGPYLHLGGRVRQDLKLPYFFLEKLLPQLQFMGVPVRLGYLVYLGLLVAGALAIAAIGRRLRRPWAGAALAAVSGALLLLEYRAQPFTTTELHAPPPMEAWAADREQFAVLDVSDDYRMMWHATVHRKPMTGGNLTRVPQRLEDWYWGQPIVKALRRGGIRIVQALERTDPSIDFDWRQGGPDPAVGADQFRARWAGELELPRAGEWTFFLSSDDGSTLLLDGRPVVLNGGIHPLQERSARIPLEAGRHALRLEYEEVSGDAAVKLEWEGPGTKRQPIPSTALRTRTGEPGLTGTYLRSACPIPREEGLANLRRLGVRFVVTRDEDNECLRRELDLEQVWGGEGLRIYEVPL